MNTMVVGQSYETIKGKEGNFERRSAISGEAKEQARKYLKVGVNMLHLEAEKAIKPTAEIFMKLNYLILLDIYAFMGILLI
ncbi:hypothetical protein RIF29_16146 [Crotalaria pallida]|uniref:Uncharacterized protein n=1 Tax=Crotalaria pallida TaxID=3830 RepID=A0AAN9FKF9_CROPI